MAIEALNWALKQKIKPSSAKFVLAVLANHANDSDISWPSLASITESTSCDRKTVIEAIKRLVQSGYLVDTGERKGQTGQVIVYRLKRSDIGTIEEAQLGNGSESRTVPKSADNSTVFPQEQSQFSLVTVPKTGHGTNNNLHEQSGNHQHSSSEEKAVSLENSVVSNLTSDIGSYSAAFEAAWSDYPKRAGGNSKAGAWKAWKARLASGYSADEMHAGVTRYTGYLRYEDKVGSKYVKQASTFFGPDLHFLELWAVPQDDKPRTQRAGVHLQQQDYAAGWGTNS